MRDERESALSPSNVLGVLPGPLQESPVTEVRGGKQTDIPQDRERLSTKAMAWTDSHTSMSTEHNTQHSHTQMVM